MASLRDKPEPFSKTNSGKSKPRCLSHACMTRSLAPMDAGLPKRSKLSVKKTCRAMTLLENLLMSFTAWINGPP